MSRKIIVFGSDFITTLGLIRSVGEMGRKVVLLLRTDNRSKCYIDRSKYIEKVYYVATSEEGIDVLRNEYYNKKEMPIILCGTDQAVSALDANYDELKEHFCFFNAGQEGRINHFLNKANTFEIAKVAGLNTIETICASRLKDVPEDIKYPCLIKGNNSTTSTKDDMHICASSDELHAKWHDGVDYLIQTYINRKFELDIIGLSWNHGENIFMPAVVRKVRDSMAIQSAYIRLDDIAEYPGVDKEAIARFVREIKYEGIFSVEMIYDGERFYLLEINLRNDACGYLYTKAGVNYPWLWVRYCEGCGMAEEIAKTRAKTPMALMQQVDMYNMKAGVVPLLKWLRQALMADAHFVLQFRDIRPYLRAEGFFLKAVLKRIKRRFVGHD